MIWNLINDSKSKVENLNVKEKLKNMYSKYDFSKTKNLNNISRADKEIGNLNFYMLKKLSKANKDNADINI